MISLLGIAATATFDVLETIVLGSELGIAIYTASRTGRKKGGNRNNGKGNKHHGNNSSVQ